MPILFFVRYMLTSLALAADLAVAPGLGPGPGPDQEEDLALDLKKLKHHDMND